MYAVLTRIRTAADAHDLLGTPRRWAVFAVGITLLALGVATSILAGLGVASWQVFETGLVSFTGAPFGVVVVIESLVALALAWAWLRQPPGVATLIIALVVGPMIGWMLGALPAPATLPWRIAWLVGGGLSVSVGVGLYVAAEVGPSAQDCLFVGLYRRYRMRPATARFAIDASLVTLGWMLGGQVGIGTIAVTFLAPPIVERTLFAGRRLAGTDDRPLTRPASPGRAAPAG